jgi:hypothetical protein
MVDTPMTAGLQPEIDRYALKRIAEPLEIAQAILFLTGTEVVICHRGGAGDRWGTYVPLKRALISRGVGVDIAKPERRLP